jgi:hypothetical protein
MGAGERSSAPRQSWCAMLRCPRSKHAKQAAAAKRSTKQSLAASPKRSIRDSAGTEKKTREKENTMANGVKNETALAQRASENATSASVCPNVNDVYATPVHELLSTLGDDLSTTDEENGIWAMCNEINQQFPDLEMAPAQACMKATFAGMFQVYTETLKNINDQEITRDLTHQMVHDAFSIATARTLQQAQCRCESGRARTMYQGYGRVWHW